MRNIEERTRCDAKVGIKSHIRHGDIQRPPCANALVGEEHVQARCKLLWTSIWQRADSQEVGNDVSQLAVSDELCDSCSAMSVQDLECDISDHLFKLLSSRLNSSPGMCFLQEIQLLECNHGIAFGDLQVKDVFQLK